MGMDTLSEKVENLERRVVELEMIVRTKKEPAVNSIRAAVQKYLETSKVIRRQWKGELTSVEEVRLMRRHGKGY